MIKLIDIYNNEIKQNSLYLEFCESVELYNSHILLEKSFGDFFVGLSSKLKSIWQFIKDIAQTLKVKITDLIKLFLNNKVFDFFKYFKFSFKKLWEFLKAGYNNYLKLVKAISEYISKTKIVKWTTEELKKLDEWLEKNPTIKKLSGIAVAGILLFIWFNMTFSGAAFDDFDISDILSALSGKFTLHTIFGGANGSHLLLAFITGLMGLTFPWPGGNLQKLIAAVITTLTKKLHIKLNKDK